jgi:eukaryotic-like serine/threonine-protein kinase
MERLAAALAAHYRLERELGAGGMATVYLAQDLKHDRKVAVKVLRPELAAVIGAERFLAEIKTTANLQHPHILGLIDSGDADGFLYYVMPYIEGESLRDRLTREKQLPVDVAVRVAGEVASALDYAHRHNIIHRDIKPENILLHDGSALVADFGIALAASKAGGTRMTETGMSLGTPHYMSPEQAMGEREITARSDVYALGCVLYEMLVGEPPFTGPTAQSIVAKVMTDDPRPLHTLRRTVPPAIEDAVLTALEKLPADRFASAAEFGAALAGQRGSGPGRQRGSGAARRSLRSGSRAVTAALGALLILVTVIALWGWLRPGPPVAPPSRLAILAPGLGGGGGAALQRQLALSPDGGEVFFVTLRADGSYQVMRQPLAAAEAIPVDGTAGISSPLISPDGRFLLGTRNGQGSFRYPVEGGSPSPLAEAVHGTSSADWGWDGSLWFSPEQGLGRGMAMLSASDSVSYPFIQESKDLQMMQVLPDGRTALVGQKLGAASGPLLLFDLKTGRRTSLLERPIIEARYTAGYLVWVLPDGTLQAQPFDASHPRLMGTAQSIATGVSVTGTGLAQLAVARNGTVAYIPEEPRSLQLIDRSGSARAATADRRNFHAPEFSSDGRRLSTDFNTADGRDVWILSLDDGTLSRATFDRDGHDATWTPDGNFITYSSTRSGALGIYRKRPGSAEPAESLYASLSLSYTGLWLKDGSGLVTTGSDLRPGSRTDIALVQNAGRGPLTPIVSSAFEDQHPALSPDNHWLAFTSDQSGTQQVYVRPYPGEGDQVQVSLTGGNEPLWSPDGRELYYRGVENGEPTLIAAAVRTAPGVAVTTRRPLFSVADYVGTIPHTNYAISPDGKTFAMVRRNPATRVMIIQNLPGLVRQVQGSSKTAR